jgi:CDP-diacylglycerol--glycerol-3-phosphate 3-phosphatidyltransferase
MGDATASRAFKDKAPRLTDGHTDEQQRFPRPLLVWAVCPMSNTLSSMQISRLASPTPANRQALTRLHWRWGVVALFYVAIGMTGFWLLYTGWGQAHAQRWLLLTGLVMTRQLWLLWQSLPLNHREDETALLPTLGYGTALTIGRGIAIALLAGFIFSPRPPGWLAWLPAILYSVGAVFDYLDGYVARVTDHATKLGESLDMEYDVIGVLAAVLLAISYGQLPVWYLAVGLAREIFLLGHWILRKQGHIVYDLPESSDRRLIAGLQMGFLSVVLWPVFTPPATTLAAILFAVPLLISFGRDWLVTSGMLPADSSRYHRMRTLAKSILEGWIPTVARPLGALAALTILLREAPLFLGWTTYAQSAGLKNPAPLFWVLAVISAAALLLFIGGIVGRFAAIPLIALASWDLLAVGFVWQTNGLLLTAAIIVLQMGSGYFAIWRPEETLIRRRAGDQKAGHK